MGYVALSPSFGPPEKARVRHPILISPCAWCWGTLRMQGLRSKCASFWAPEKARVRQPIPIFPRATIAKRRMCIMIGVVGIKSGMCVPCSAHPTLLSNALASGFFFGARTLGGALVCLTTSDRPARRGVLCDTHHWVHLPAHHEPSTPPIVAPNNGSHTAPVVRTPPQPEKQGKVRSRAHTSMPTTTRTTLFGRRNKPPSPTDGGYLSEGDSTLENR